MSLSKLQLSSSSHNFYILSHASSTYSTDPLVIFFITFVNAVNYSCDLLQLVSNYLIYCYSFDIQL